MKKILFIGLMFICGSVGAVSPINTGLFGKKAIKSYDPVAYFTQSAPVKGEKSIRHSWNGADWFFANSGNRDLFIQNPEKYAPQYGGYCAWAVSQNSTANIDPTAWTIVDGKLYLNYSKKIQKRWEGDVSGFIEKANGFWPELRD